MTADVTGVSWERVTKYYGPRTALNHLSLELGPGIHALLGPNGAGKTTALNLLSGIRLADYGVVRVCGEPVTRGGRHAVHLSSTPQALSFPPMLRVREVVDFIASHYPKPSELTALSQRLPLGELLELRCGALSGGQTRIVGLACALIGNTQVLILDEPSTGLDLEARASLRRVLREERDKGRCVILSTHDYAEAETEADTASVIQGGRLILHERLSALRSETAACTPGLTLERKVSALLEGRLEGEPS